MAERLSLTRAELDELIAPEVARAVALTRETLATPGVGTLRALYLTGGSSRIPLVHRELQALGPLATLDDPKTVVAQGALIAANQLPSAVRPMDAVPTAAPRSRGWLLPVLLGATAFVVVTAAAVGTALVMRGGTQNHAGGATTSTSAPATSDSAMSGATTSTDDKGADVRTVLAALPSPLRNAISNCGAADDALGLGVSLGSAPAGLYSCTIKPNDALITGLTNGNPLSDSNGLTLLMVGLTSDTTGEANDLRKNYPTLLENDQKVVGVQDTLGDGNIVLQYLNTNSGVIVAAGMFTSKQSAQTFVSRAGL